MKKSELIELLHLAESNHRVLAEAYKIAVDTSKCKSCPLTLDEKDRRQVRAEAIEEVKSKMISFHTDKVFRYGADIIEAKADAFDELKDWLEKQSRK